MIEYAKLEDKEEIYNLICILENKEINKKHFDCGFGGCTVNIVKNNSIDEFIEKIEQKYETKFGITPDFYVVEMGDGARRIE